MGVQFLIIRLVVTKEVAGGTNPLDILLDPITILLEGVSYLN